VQRTEAVEEQVEIVSTRWMRRDERTCPVVPSRELTASAPLEIEGPVGLLGSPSPQSAFAPFSGVNDLEVDRGVVVNALEGLVVMGCVRGSQGWVAVDERLESVS
jgi:hypothetical protein